MEENRGLGKLASTADDAVVAAKRRERIVRLLLFAAASVALVVTGAIIWTLVDGTIRFFGASGTSLSAFFGNPQWGGIATVLGLSALGLLAAEAFLWGGSNVLGGVTRAQPPSLRRRLRTRLVARWSVIATTPIVYAINREFFLPLFPSNPVVAVAVPTVPTLGYVWLAGQLAGEDVLPTRDLPGPGDWPRAIGLGAAAIVFAAVVTTYDLSTSTFLGSVQWAGVAGEFSIWSLASGTVLVAIGALILAGPVGVGAALYLAEFADERVRAIGKPIVEVLAGVPSIVYGFFALFTISPFMQEQFGGMTYNAGSAILVVSVMVLPIVVSLSEDAISSVPGHLRDASLAMGATEWETSLNVILPAARSGVFASLFLGLARALGETMAVLLAAGNIARWHLNPLMEVQTMTTYIARVSTGDIPPGPATDAAFAVGLVLFVITYTVNLGGQEILDRMGVDEV